MYLPYFVVSLLNHLSGKMTMVTTKPTNKGFVLPVYTFLGNFLCTQLSYQRAGYMMTTKQIPKKTILRSKQKTLTDRCQRPWIDLFREFA
jgi:hypothetical protein